MNILRLQFSAYNRKKNHFAQCFLLIKERMYSVSSIYEICVSRNYFICSEIIVDQLLRHKCEEGKGKFWKAYCAAEKNGFSFTDFSDNGEKNEHFNKFPRIGTLEFENVVNNLGGKEIPETQKQNPSFELKNNLIAFKDLQEEGLENTQQSIANIFANENKNTINIDPSLNLGAKSNHYHSFIKNRLKDYFNTASREIKNHKKNRDFKSSGIVLFNTGLYSLPHEMCKKMVTDILNKESKTITFALIFSQKMQTNEWNMNAVFVSEWIGNKPPELNELKSELDDLVNIRMTELLSENERLNIIESQKPISFEIANKVFYWNPGQLNFP